MKKLLTAALFTLASFVQAAPVQIEGFNVGEQTLAYKSLDQGHGTAVIVKLDCSLYDIPASSVTFVIAKDGKITDKGCLLKYEDNLYVFFESPSGRAGKMKIDLQSFTMIKQNVNKPVDKTTF